jgi:hypothetical protein
VAAGFKVADAYIEVHVDDDTKKGRRDIDRDTRRWADNLGKGIGEKLLSGLTTGLRGLFTVLKGSIALIAFTARMALLGLVIGTVVSAVAGLLGALVNLIPVLHELVVVLIQAAGVLLLYPAAIASALIAFGTLKLGFQGISAALKAGLSGDLQALNKALEKLAPNAAAFVSEIIKAKPAFDRMRLQIQNSLFEDLAELLRKMSQVYLPILTHGLDTMAIALNQVFKNIGQFLLGAQTQNDIGTIMQNAARAATELGAVLTPALAILRDVLVVSTKVLADLTAKLVPIFQVWADSIERMRADGSLEKLILDGVEALKLFASLAGDLIGILGGISRAAGEGGGLFSFFDRLNTLVNSVSGQATLTQLFTALGDAAVALTPVLLVLLQALVPILQGISQIAVAFAPGLTVVVTALGQALAALVPAFIALAPLMDVIAEGLMPIAQILVDLVVNAAPSLTEFFRLLADALAELAPIAAPVGKALGLLVLLLSDVLAGVLPLVIELLGFLADVLIVILTPLEPLVRQMIPMLTLLFHQLFDALQPLLPALFAVAMTLAQAFIDNKDAIITLLVQWIDLFTILAQKMTGEFVQALTMIIPLLPGLVESGLAFSQVLLELAQTLMPLIMLFLDLTNNGEAWRVLLLAFIGWSIIATNVIQLFITWLRALYEIFRLIIQVLDWVIEQIKRFVSWVTSGFSQISSAIGGALHNAYQAILNFGVNMYNAGANLISQLIGGIRSMLGPVGNAVGSVVQRVKDFFNWSPAKRGPLSGRGDMRYAGQNLVGRLVEGVQQGMTEAEQAAATLAGLFGVGGAGRFAFAGVGGAAGGQPRPIYAFVQIGERPVKEMVEATILDNPEAVAKATSEGNRQDAAITGRKRIGDT